MGTQVGIGASQIATEPYPLVATYADLPAAAPFVNRIYIVTTTTGVWFVNRKRRGLWRSNGAAWERMGIAPTRDDMGLGTADDVQFGSLGIGTPTPAHEIEINKASPVINLKHTGIAAYALTESAHTYGTEGGATEYVAAGNVMEIVTYSGSVRKIHLTFPRDNENVGLGVVPTYPFHMDRSGDNALMRLINSHATSGRGIYLDVENPEAATFLLRLMAATVQKFNVDLDGDVTTPGAFNFSNKISPPELTIAAGVITVSTNYHKVDTQNDDPADDLDTINGGSDGDLLILRQVNDARDVTLKDGTGNLVLAGGADCVFTNRRGYCVLIYDSASGWCEISRSLN